MFPSAFPTRPNYNPPLVVENGVTYASGVFSGTITINQGGTLRVMAPPAGTITAAKDVTVTGSLDGENSDVNFYMRGQNFVVNGSVSVAELHMAGASQQTITGTGSLNLHDLYVDAPGGVKLNAPLSLDGHLSFSQNLYVGSSTLVTLTESAITAGENSDKDIFGTVKRTGPFQTDKPYRFGNLNLDCGLYECGHFTAHGDYDDVLKRPGKTARFDRSQRQHPDVGWQRLDCRFDAGLSRHGTARAGRLLQAWTRSSSSTPWARIPYSEANFNQNWIAFQGLTHFSDWGLVIHSICLPRY